MGVKINTGDIIFLDTAPFIYFFERHQEFFPVLDSLFAQVHATGAQAITSIFTYIELTTHPARLGRIRLVRKYRDYLTNSISLPTMPHGSSFRKRRCCW